MNLRKMTITVVLVMLMLSITSMIPANAQSDRLEIVAAEDCADGLTLTIEGEVAAGETMLVAWFFADEALGFAINQVALTDLPGDEHEIVIPHLPMANGASTNYSVLLLTEESTQALMAMLMVSMMMQELPNESMLEATLKDLPLYGDELSAGRCSIAGMQPTISNVEVDPEAIQAGIAELLESMAGGMEQ